MFNVSLQEVCKRRFACYRHSRN